ncbi:tetratricopeptide repeat protein [Mucilaginibacter sp.]|uniref:tetratricopeptide repeat protein n=1 Tax=Mucilaginibacter sp. TaxID=1882438 RepID=UPI003267701F
MKPLYKTLLLLAFVAISVTAYSQDRDKVKELIKQGVALNDEGKYDDAIAKYAEALKIEPGSYNANYETAYTLQAKGKPLDAIPYLEAAIKINPESGDGYNMIGNIYDDNKQPDKALEYYKRGIAAAPDYQRLYYNIAVTYYGQKQYTDAEASAITAIKLDPKHASSQRIFAMATNRQNKLGASLLGWCSFLLIEPQTKRSPEALTYVKAIINNGVKKTGEKSVTITINEKDLSSSNLLMPLTVTNATSDKKNLSATDSLTLQFTALFEIAHVITGDKDNPFVASYYSDFFEKLAKSGNMAAFTRYISLSAYKDENLAWFKEHDKDLAAFDDWLKATKREF